jgi:tetratricopeptide (TPR) repeat protein
MPVHRLLPLKVRPLSMPRFWHLALIALLLCACATTGNLAKSASLRAAAPVSVVTEASYPDAVRAFERMNPQTPERAALRERIAVYWLSRGDVAITADRFADVVSALAQISDLYAPNEWSNTALPGGLDRMARYLVAKGSPRGDEARVLSGLLILKLLHPEDSASTERYEKLVSWGFDARADMSGPLEPFEGLVEAWEEHARLTPTPEVLATLVRLYTQRRDALVRLFQSSEEQVPLSASVFQGVQRTALNVAAVFLRHGDTASALTQVRALGQAGGLEERLGQMLEATREDDNNGAGALLDLSRAYLEAGRPDVARALCIDGLRTRNDDARFPQCLARIAATENDFGGALAWYSDAIDLVPEERALYDEILEVLNGLIEQGTLGSNFSGTRALATRATEILKERMRRWPKSAPPVSPEELYAAIGALEMNSGNAKQAEAYFRDSLKSRPLTAACLQFGILLERTGRPREARDQYRAGLELLTGNSPDLDRQRAELLEHVGDSERVAGMRDDAAHSYDKALALWDTLLPAQKAKRSGAAQLRRGVLLGRLGRFDEAKAAFERAIDAAPTSRETYATILAFLVASAPDAAFAHEVFHTAQNQLGLEPEWKVYFALWLRMIAGRTGQALEGDVMQVFETPHDAEGWWAKLARFGSGKLNYDTLLEETTAVGERAEAYFYEGGRRLAQGDEAGARTMFSKVLETQMVNFYEFAMAQELLTTQPIIAQPNMAASKAP